jgi:hypothetical protein
MQETTAIPNVTPVPVQMPLPVFNKKSKKENQKNYHMFSLWAHQWGLNAFKLIAHEKVFSGGIHNHLAISQNLQHVHLPVGPITKTPGNKG